MDTPPEIAHKHFVFPERASLVGPTSEIDHLTMNIAMTDSCLINVFTDKIRLNIK